jgi:PAS domain S-box-containing protein
MQRMGSSISKKLGLAILCPVIAAMLQSLLWSFVTPNEFMFFYPAIIFAGLYGGFLFGVVSAFVASILTFWMFFPRNEIHHVTLPGELLSICLFLLTSVLMIFICDRMRYAKSQRRLAAEALGNFKLVGQIIPHIIWTTRPDGYVDYVNDAWINYTGFSEAQADGWGWIKSVHPDDIEIARTAWNRAVKEEIPYEAIYRLRQGSDGSYRWFLARAVPVRNELGRIVKWYGSNADIHEQKRNQAELQSAIRERDRSLAVLDALFSAVPVGIEIFDREFRYIRLNEKLAEINAIPMKDTLGKRPHEILPEIAATIEPILKEVLDRGKAFINMEVQGQTQLEFKCDRTWLVSLFPIKPKASPEYNHDEKILGIGAAVIEITERRIMEKRLEEAIFMRDEFVSIASHELKTPLTSIQLHALLLQRECSKADVSDCSQKRINKFIEMTLTQVDRISRLVDDMLDVARMRTGNLTLSKDVFNLSDALKETVYRHAPDFKAAGIDIPTVDFPGTSLGSWDRLRIEQVATNLLNNAIKYGDGKPISIHMTCDDQRAHFSVQDHGPGIPKESLAKIFDRFERGHYSKKIAGLGLGLFISRQIIESHGGKIWAESELGKGSTFHVELPLNSDLEKKDSEKKAA